MKNGMWSIAPNVVSLLATIQTSEMFGRRTTTAPTVGAKWIWRNDLWTLAMSATNAQVMETTTQSTMMENLCATAMNAGSHLWKWMGRMITDGIESQRH